MKKQTWKAAVSAAATPRRGSLLYGTKMIRAAIAAALCMAATVRATAYTIVDYWTGSYNSNWNVYSTVNANWRYGADNKGTANYPNETAHTKHAVFHPD